MKLAFAFPVLTLALALASSARAQPDEWIIDPQEPRVGDVFRMSLRLPAGVHAGTVTFLGNTVAGFETGGLLNAYLGVDLDVVPGPQHVEYAMGKESGSIRIVVAERAFGSESLAVDSEYSALDEETKARVDREAEELEAIWRHAATPRLWTKGFVQPAAGEMGPAFGLRCTFNGEPRSPHAGVDIQAPPGSGVYAANDGRVVLAKELYATGKTVVVDHGLGLYTLYAHLSRLDVEAGSDVARAQPVGLVGATGRVTGPHLHWGAMLVGARVDPMTLPGMPR